MDTIRTLLVVKCQRSAILLAHIAEETAALETMADIQKRKGWFAALASCKRTLTSIEVPSNDTYVPIKLGDWLADDVRTFLSAIFATLWRVQRKVAACERRLQNADTLDKPTIVKYAPMLKTIAETLEKLNLGV